MKVRCESIVLELEALVLTREICGSQDYGRWLMFNSQCPVTFTKDFGAIAIVSFEPRHTFRYGTPRLLAGKNAVSHPVSMMRQPPRRQTVAFGEES